MRMPGLLLLVALLAPPASGDVLVLADGRKLRGGVHREGPDGVAFNPFFSRHPDMVFEVQSFPASAVKEVVREEAPLAQFLRRLGELPGGDVGACLELARWCGEQKLSGEREIALLRALRIDAGNEEALKEFGRSRFPRIARGDPDFDPAAREAIEAYLGVADPEERERAYGRLKREASVDLPREYLDRVIRSRDQPKGLQTDRPLTLRTEGSPGVYTLFVPDGYDPRRPWPLVMGLHGGGVGGREGDAVVGSGSSAMNFYVREAAARGYLVVCPTARAAPWASTANEDFLLAVLEEVELLYHVDLNRVYLTGHSMGGFGAWHYGPKWAELWAAVSPMAGGGGGGARRLVDTATPVFVFHGADDGVVGPSSDRAAAKSLAGTGHDFVYTELDGVGHGFPASIQKDLFDFFDVRRLAPMRGRRPGPPSALPRSSFRAKVSRDEQRYLGDPLEYGGGGPERVKDLLKDLRLGGGKAEAAADRLGELGDEEAVKPLSDLLRHPDTAGDVKVQAARALGLIGHEDGYPGLAAGLRSEHFEVFATSARAMPRIAAKKAGEALVASLGHLDGVLESKRIGGNRMHISDWERWLPAYGAAVVAIGELRPGGATAAIRRSAVRKVIAADWDVMYSPRVGQDPKAARRSLALATIAVLRDLADPELPEILAEIREARADDPEIRAACE